MMLTKKQKRKLDDMVANYLYGMIKSSVFPEHLIEAWSKRYRIAMERVLSKRCKH